MKTAAVLLIHIFLTPWAMADERPAHGRYSHVELIEDETLRTQVARRIQNRETIRANLSEEAKRNLDHRLADAIRAELGQEILLPLLESGADPNFIGPLRFWHDSSLLSDSLYSYNFTFWTGKPTQAALDQIEHLLDYGANPNLHLLNFSAKRAGEAPKLQRATTLLSSGIYRLSGDPVQKLKLLKLLARYGLANNEEVEFHRVYDFFQGPFEFRFSADYFKEREDLQETKDRAYEKLQNLTRESYRQYQDCLHRPVREGFEPFWAGVDKMGTLIRDLSPGGALYQELQKVGLEYHATDEIIDLLDNLPKVPLPEHYRKQLSNP